MESSNNKIFSKLVAVYGTLRKGEFYHHLIKDAKFLGFHRSNEEFYMIHIIEDYPVLTPKSCLSLEEIDLLSKKNIFSTTVVFEIYDLNEDDWNKVCVLEDFSGIRGDSNNLYETMDIETQYGKADIFIQFKVPSGISVNNGDYVDFLNKYKKRQNGKSY